MKICFLLPVNGRSGGMFTVYEHAKGLIRLGHDVHIVFQDEMAPLVIDAYPDMGKVPRFRLSQISPNDRYDYAIATWWETVYALHRISATRYGYFVQGFEPDFYFAPMRNYKPLVEATYREDLDFFAISEALVRYLSTGFGSSGALIRNTIDFERFYNAKPLVQKGDRLRVLIEGPPGLPFKRVAEAFNALKGLTELEVFFLSSGGKPHEGWKVDHFYEAVPYQQVPEIYASCDILLKLSATESFSLPVLEMFAAGGTAIVSGFPGHDEYIKDGVNALVVPIQEPGLAREALLRLMADPKLLAALRAHARLTCEGFVRWEQSTSAFEVILADRLQQRVVQSFGKEVEHFRTFYEDLKILELAYNQVPLLEHQKATFYTEIERLRTEIERLREEVRDTNKELKDARLILNSMTSGLSWKIGRVLTAPARGVRAALKR